MTDFFLSLSLNYQNQHLHAIFHNMYGCFPCCGHAFAVPTRSNDGVSMNYSKWVYTGGDACGALINFTDGGQGNLGRRERPHLLFDEKQRPVMLTNGGTYWPGFAPRNHDHSFTIAQPISVSGDGV
jgi:hypothetical protein